jgi:hypothetical protein
MSAVELLDIIRSLKTLYKEEVPDFSSYRSDLPKAAATVIPTLCEKPLPQIKVSTETKIELPPLTLPSFEEDETDIQEESEVALWSKKFFTPKAAIHPIICLGIHPMMEKLAQAISDQIAPASCVKNIPDLNHPLLKVLLIPAPLLSRWPELQKRCQHLACHQWAQPFLILHPLETYQHDQQAKRNLWNLLLQLPVF